MIRILLLLIPFILMGCTTTEALDNIFRVSGTLSNSGSPVDGAKITITDINASEHHSAYQKVGSTYYSDSLGQFTISLGCGTTWTEKSNGSKEYTVYIASIEILVQKENIKDTSVIIVPSSLEETDIDHSIILQTR